MYVCVKLLRVAYLRRQTARSSLPLLSGRDGCDCGAVCSGPAVLPITPTGASQRGGCQPKTQLQEQHLQASQVSTQVSFGHTHTHTHTRAAVFMTCCVGTFRTNKYFRTWRWCPGFPPASPGSRSHVGENFSFLLRWMADGSFPVSFSECTETGVAFQNTSLRCFRCRDPRSRLPTNEPNTAEYLLKSLSSILDALASSIDEIRLDCLIHEERMRKL